MSPLRIIIIIVLIYIAYRLIFGGRKSAPTARKMGRSQPSDLPLSDTLEEDPVCKKLIPSRQAINFEWRGKKLYFCSQECCNTFRTKQGEQK